MNIEKFETDTKRGPFFKRTPSFCDGNREIRHLKKILPGIFDCVCMALLSKILGTPLASASVNLIKKFSKLVFLLLAQQLP